MTVEAIFPGKLVYWNICVHQFLIPFLIQLSCQVTGFTKVFSFFSNFIKLISGYRRHSDRQPDLFEREGKDEF